VCFCSWLFNIKHETLERSQEATMLDTAACVANSACFVSRAGTSLCGLRLFAFEHQTSNTGTISGCNDRVRRHRHLLCATSLPSKCGFQRFFVTPLAQILQLWPLSACAFIISGSSNLNIKHLNPLRIRQSQAPSPALHYSPAW
jgi:hypothetical protein